MIKQTYRNHKTDFSGQPSYRYWKLVYTAALRLGKALELDDYIDITFSGSPYKTDTPKDEKHSEYNSLFLGTLTLDKETFENIVFIHNTESSKPRAITFWPKSDNPSAAESTVNPLIILAMKGEPISPKHVASDMHPEFLKDPGINPIILINRLKDNSYETADELLKLAERWKDKVTAEKEKNRIFEDENMELKKENERLKSEQAELIREKASANADGKEVTEHQGLVLKAVETDIMIGQHLNTVLSFEDGSRKTIKISSFDKDLSVTKKAQTLIGRRVTTTCWDRKDKPGLFSGMGYFQNIYEVE